MDILTVNALVRILVVIGAVALLTLIARRLLFRFIPPLLARQSPRWNEILPKYKALNYLALSVPGFLFASFEQFTFDFDQNLSEIIYKAAVIYSITMLTAAVVAALRAYNDFYDQNYDFAKEVPIKTVIQTAEVLVIIISGVIIMAILLEVSVLALTGVIMAIVGVGAYLFSVPLLGFSASLQLSMNHMLAIGDWIEMEKYNVDGYVEDINVTSTKIRNRDNSIINVPTNILITDSFQNWRSMQDKEARRVLRPIYIDQTSVGFVSIDDKREKLQQVTALHNVLADELRQNIGLQGVRPEDLSERAQLTNLELFMAYATLFIAGHPQVRSDYDLYLRQQDPTPQGLPVEVFFFTRATDFVPYYAVQREIISHLLAKMPEFGLQPYQLSMKQ